MSKSESEYCPRCDDTVPVEVPHPGWKLAKIAWWILAGTLAVLAPILASDVMILTPFAFAIVIGGIPIFERARQEVRCATCLYPVRRSAK